jgi:hypothetical protein
MTAALKSIPIRDPETGAAVGQYFEPSDSFKAAAAAGQVTRVRTDGKEVQVSKKLLARGYYDDKGLMTPEQARMANARAAKKEKEGSNE